MQWRYECCTSIEKSFTDVNEQMVALIRTTTGERVNERLGCISCKLASHCSKLTRQSEEDTWSLIDNSLSILTHKSYTAVENSIVAVGTILHSCQSFPISATSVF